MTVAVHYSYQESTRRLEIVVVATIGAVLTALALKYGAPTLFFLPVGGALAMALWMLAVGRVSGSRLGATHLELYSGRWHQHIAIAEIIGYRLTSWSESADWVHLQLRDRDEELLIPSYCLGNVDAFVAGLDALGVRRRATS